MGGMLVGWVMDVQSFGLGGSQYGVNGRGERRAVAANGGTGVTALQDEAVVPDAGGFRLFLLTEGDVLVLRELGVGAGSRSACAIGASDAAKPLIGLLVAGADAVERHEFEIVWMRSDAEMRGARECVIIRGAVGDKEFGFFCERTGPR